MNTLWIIIIVVAVLLYLVVEFVNAWADRRAMRGLEMAYKREAALNALAGISHTVRSTDQCIACGQPVLVENTKRGVCADCMDAVLSFAYENDALPAPDADWADLMHAIDDEDREGRDHR